MRGFWHDWFVLAAFLTVVGDGSLLRSADAPASSDPKETKIDGKTAKEWAALLRESKDAGERQDAARALRDLGPDAAFAVEALTSALTDADASVRTLSAVALGKIGRPARLALPRLVEGLNDSNAQVRLASLQSINSLAQRCSEGVAALGKALHHKDNEVRDEAIDSLGELGPRAYPALADLIKALREQESQVRVRLIRVIGRIGPRAQAAVPVLVAANRFETHREPIARALGTIGPAALPQASRILDEGLDAETSSVRVAAALALWQTARQAQRVAFIAEELKNDKAETRIQALSALAEIGPAARSAANGIADLVLDKQPRVREWAAFALAAVQADAETTVPKLRGLLEDKDEAVVAAAIKALGVYGASAKGEVGQLNAFAEGKAGRLRDAAIQALAGIGSDAATAVPTLKKLAADGDNSALAALPYLGDAGVRALANLLQVDKPDSPLQALAQVSMIVQLERAGPRARAAIPVLIEKLDDSFLHAMAALALAKIGKEAVEPLREAMVNHTKEPVRRGAALALGIMGTEAKAAIPDLVKMLNDPNNKARWIAADALGQIGAADREAVLPALAKALTDEDRSLRLHAAEAHWKLASKPEAVLDVFRQVLADAKSPQRSRAAAALEQLGLAAAPVVHELAKALDSSDHELQLHALFALAAIGGPAKDAASKIERFLTSSDPALRAAALLTATRLDPQRSGTPAALVEVLIRGDLPARLAALRAIRSLAPDVKGKDSTALQIALLDVLCEGEDRPPTRVVAEALTAFGEEGVTKIAGLLASPDLEQRVEIAEVLERLGERGRPAVAMLVWAARDRHAHVRDTALAALRKIDPAAAAKLDGNP